MMVPGPLKQSDPEERRMSKVEGFYELPDQLPGVLFLVVVRGLIIGDTELYTVMYHLYRLFSFESERGA